MSITRRKFLKTKGAAMALPFLPSIASAIAEPEKEAKPSKKLVMMYVPNGLVRRCFFPGEEQTELPGFVGGFNADKSKDEKRISHGIDHILVLPGTKVITSGVAAGIWDSGSDHPAVFAVFERWTRKAKK